MDVESTGLTMDFVIARRWEEGEGEGEDAAIGSR